MSFQVPTFLLFKRSITTIQDTITDGPYSVNMQMPFEGRLLPFGFHYPGIHICRANRFYELSSNFENLHAVLENK